MWLKPPLFYPPKKKSSDVTCGRTCREFGAERFAALLLVAQLPPPFTFSYPEIKRRLIKSERELSRNHGLHIPRRSALPCPSVCVAAEERGECCYGEKTS